MFRIPHRAMLLAAAVVALAPVDADANRAAQAAYGKTREAYYRLTGDRNRQRFRHNWLGVIRGFEAIVERHPESPEAPKALYNTAELWRAMYGVSGLRADLSEAAQTYGRLAERYGDSSLADDALYHRAVLQQEHWGDIAAAREGLGRMLRLYPKGDMATKGRRLLARLPTGPGRSPPAAPVKAGSPAKAGRDDAKPLTAVKGVRVGRHKGYTRVVAELTTPVKPPITVTTRPVEADDAAGVPPRIIVEISAAGIEPSAVTELRPHDPLVRAVRLQKHGASRVRLLVELERPATPRLELLQGPARIVVDAVATDARAGQPHRGPSAQRPGASRRRPRVVLDPGHGGRDVGAMGKLKVRTLTWKKVREKDVTLAVAKEAARYLEASGVEVLLTRGDDRFVTLGARTAFANRKKADLFVSIHANSAPQSHVRGVETYVLDVANDRYALRLAALENQTSEKEVGDLQLILADLSTKAHSRESAALARRLQTRMMTRVRTLNPKARDLGVKGALFYVLLGARMPAVLVEASFLSNPTEARLLASTGYRRKLAKAIAEAVAEHLKTPLHIVRP